MMFLFCTLRTRLNRISLLLLSVCVIQSAPVFANEQVFKAEYTGKYRGLSVKAYRILVRTGENTYQYQFELDHTLANISESSKFSVSEAIALPQSYIFRRKIVGISSSETINFDWQKQKARYKHSKKSHRNGEVDIKPGHLDPLLQQLLLQLKLTDEKNALNFSFVKRKGIKSYSFERKQLENITINKQNQRGLHVVRTNMSANKSLDMWFLPEQSYQLGLIKFDDKDGESYQLSLKQQTTNNALFNELLLQLNALSKDNN